MKRPLSRRECQVYHLVGEGLPHKEIAFRLGINPKTVSTFVTSVANKLGLPGNSAVLRHASIASEAEKWARLAEEQGVPTLAALIRQSCLFEDVRLGEVLAGLEVEHTR
jgi:DNA-binding CsgD family transcriptional regulator